MNGYLDEAVPGAVRGWVATNSENDPTLILRINGSEVLRAPANLYRPDLAAAGLGGKGFSFTPPNPLRMGDIVEVLSVDGELIQGSPIQVCRPVDPRTQSALALVTDEMKILEIGPCYNPLAPRSQGWNSYSIDYTDAETLRNKFRGIANVDRIEEVDFIWNGGPIAAAVPEVHRGTFDCIVSSHSLEHLPDPLGFLKAAVGLLCPGGLLSLVIPDKRYTFDFFRFPTTTSDYLMFHSELRDRHSPKTHFDYLANIVKQNDRIVWDQSPVTNLLFFYDDPLKEGERAFNATKTPASYVDAHATVYTPASFALLILELSHLGQIDFEIAKQFPPSGCEFYVTLRAATPAPRTVVEVNRQRLELMKEVVREYGEQSRALS